MLEGDFYHNVTTDNEAEGYFTVAGTAILVTGCGTPTEFPQSETAPLADVPEGEVEATTQRSVAAPAKVDREVALAGIDDAIAAATSASQRDVLNLLRASTAAGDHGLDLSDQNISLLPPEIANLTSLRALHLIENQLTVIPPEIGNLTN